MADQATTRKLAAILAADVASYTRLMEQDEAQTLDNWWASRKEIIDLSILKYGGRIVKHTGDGFLAEFSTATDAVRCAVSMQQSLLERFPASDTGLPFAFRMGVNLGEIVVDDEDIYGAGVNIAARIEALAEPGAISLTSGVVEQVRQKLSLRLEDKGFQSLKNVAEPVHIWQWRQALDPSGAGEPDETSVTQNIKFCLARDGIQLAYATSGSGPPIVKAPNWLHHLERDWESPVWGHLLRFLTTGRTLVRFDQRANGLSDQDVPNITFDSNVSDIESVVDAAGLEHFDLIGVSQGCAYSIAYAVRHPERVQRLVLYGGFARGAKQRESQEQENLAATEEMMVLQSWGKNNPAFRQYFTTKFMPEASKEQMDWFNELQRETLLPDNAARIMQVSNNINVVDLLPRLDLPTLVLHCKEDGIIDFAEGRRMAAMIPNAQFVALDGKNHLILESEPAWPRFVEEVSRFLS